MYWMCRGDIPASEAKSSLANLRVAGPGFRSPVTRDYEPREIPTSPPQMTNRDILARLSLNNKQIVHL